MEECEALCAPDSMDLPCTDSADRVARSGSNLRPNDAYGKRYAVHTMHTESQSVSEHACPCTTLADIVRRQLRVCTQGPHGTLLVGAKCFFLFFLFFSLWSHSDPTLDVHSQ